MYSRKVVAVRTCSNYSDSRLQKLVVLLCYNMQLCGTPVSDFAAV